VDCCGQVVGVLPPSEGQAKVLYLSMPIRSFWTLYTWWGDPAILWICACFLIFGMIPLLKRAKAPEFR
jgi:hypothetical protein